MLEFVSSCECLGKMDVREDFTESSFELTATSTVVWKDMSFFEKLVEEEECGAEEGPAARPRARRAQKPKNIKCTKCSKKYTSMERYAAHLRTHTWNGKFLTMTYLNI